MIIFNKESKFIFIKLAKFTRKVCSLFIIIIIIIIIISSSSSSSSSSNDSSSISNGSSMKNLILLKAYIHIHITDQLKLNFVIV